MTYRVRIKFSILCRCKTTVRVPNFRAYKECTRQDPQVRMSSVSQEPSSLSHGQDCHILSRLQPCSPQPQQTCYFAGELYQQQVVSPMASRENEQGQHTQPQQLLQVMVLNDSPKCWLAPLILSSCSWGPFLERPSTLTGPKSDFEIKISKKQGVF